MSMERDVGGMKCGEVLAALPDFLLGVLEPAEIARLQRHLAGCHVCESFGSIYADAVAALRALAGPAPLEEDVRDRLAAGLSSALDAERGLPDE